MLLRNFDFAKKYFDFNLKIELEKTSNPPINGWYKFIDELMTALLTINNNLYFIYGEKKFLIKDSCKALIKEYSKAENEFRLVDGNNILIKFLYPLPLDFELDFMDVTPFQSDDDFKWGDFLANIINNKERQRNFIINLTERMLKEGINVVDDEQNWPRI